MWSPENIIKRLVEATAEKWSKFGNNTLINHSQILIQDYRAKRQINYCLHTPFIVTFTSMQRTPNITTIAGIANPLYIAEASKWWCALECSVLLVVYHETQCRPRPSDHYMHCTRSWYDLLMYNVLFSTQFLFSFPTCYHIWIKYGGSANKWHMKTKRGRRGGPTQNRYWLLIKYC